MDVATEDKIIGDKITVDRINIINSELTQMYQREGDLYHRYGVFFGLSDPAIWVLYGLYEDTGQALTQNDLASTWFYPKQTINHTVSTLAQKGWLRLEQLPGARNSKAVLLTEEGKRICEKIVVPLLQAEIASLRRMTEEERELLLQLAQKQHRCFEEEINKIIGEK